MKSTAFGIFATAIVHSSQGDAATMFSSSRSFSQITSRNVELTTTRYNLTSSDGGQSNRFPTAAHIETGFTSASVTVDVDEDDGNLTEVLVRPYALVSAPITNTFSATTKVFDPSISFPAPPVLITVQGQWEEKVTFTSVTGGMPTFVSSTKDPLNPASPESYRMYNRLEYAGLPFAINGVYEVKGPLTTVSTPFSVTYEPIPQSAYADVSVRSSTNFGDGFPFHVVVAGVAYSPVNSSVFFGDVDGIRFVVDARLEYALISFVEIPESATFEMAATCAIAFWSRASRRRRA